MNNDEARNRSTLTRPVLFGVGFIFLVVALATSNWQNVPFIAVAVLAICGVMLIVAGVFWPSDQEG